ncbi:MAG: metallophosphoesterase [Candidatus Bathyarchaeia archaeon]
MIRPLAPHPALQIGASHDTLVVADLHIGYEFELADMGINLPSQTHKITEALLKLIENSKPKRLIILGDLKHNIPKLSLQEWQDLPGLLNQISDRVPTVELIPGNHDAGISKSASSRIKIASSRGLIIGGREKLGLFHGHAWPSPKLFEAGCWIVGHNHPAVQFRGFFGFKSLKPIWVKAEFNRRKMVEAFLHHRNIKTNGKKPEKILLDVFGVEALCSKLVVMPAFNELLGGLALNAKSQTELLGPLLRSEALSLSDAETFLVDGTFLGKLQDLRKFG